jgi:translation initiation factor RLI1
MSDMREKLGKETKKMEIAERRRKLELEGYQADLSAMQKKIQFFQKYIAKMKKAVDDEKGELLDMSEEQEEEEEKEDTGPVIEG